MEKGESSEETLPTVYGIMIAFLTCVVGYVLWVSVIATNITFRTCIVYDISRCLIRLGTKIEINSLVYYPK